MPDRDIQYVRFVGILIAGVGALLMVLTAIGTLFALYAGVNASPSVMLRGTLTILQAFIMAFSLTSCGAEISRVKHINPQIENLRLVWTALVVIMTFSLIAGFWTAQPLSFLAGIMLVLLFSARRSIIRISQLY